MQNSHSITYGSKDEFIQALRYELGRGSFKAVQQLFETGVYIEGSKLVPLSLKDLAQKKEPLPCVLDAAQVYKEKTLFYQYIYLRIYTSSFFPSDTSLSKDISGYILNVLKFEIVKVCTDILECLLSKDNYILESSLLLNNKPIPHGPDCIAKALLEHGYKANDDLIHQFAKQSESGDLDLLLLLTSKRESFIERYYAFTCDSLKDESLIKEFFKKFEKQASSELKEQTLGAMFSAAIDECNSYENSDTQNKYMTRFQTCIDLGFDVNYMLTNCSNDYDTCTPLHYAASLGLTDVVRFLLSVSNIQLHVETYSETLDYRTPHLKYSPLSIVIYASLDSRVITPDLKDTFVLLLNAGCNTDLAVQCLNDHASTKFLDTYRELLKEHEQRNIWGDDIKRQAESSDLFKGR